MGKASDKAPAYQWFPKDAESDEAYRLMSCEELGVYERLRDHQWLEGSLPPELDKLTLIIGHGMTLRRLQAIWPKLSPCFPDDGSGRLANPRMERQRDELVVFLTGQKLRGRHGGLAKAAKARQPLATSETVAPLETSTSKHVAATPVPASVLPVAISSSPSPSPVQQPKEQVVVAQRPPNARSKRPIYQSDRFVVFDWMLEDLGRMLGPHMDDFDIHGFFDDLTQRSRKDGLVIARDETWKWLQAEVLKEAQRRQLPMAVAGSSSGVDLDAVRRQIEQADARAGR